MGPEDTAWVRRVAGEAGGRPPPSRPRQKGGGAAGGAQGSVRVMAVRLSLQRAAPWVSPPQSRHEGAAAAQYKDNKDNSRKVRAFAKCHPSKFDNPVAVGEVPEGRPPPMSLKKRPPESPGPLGTEFALSNLLTKKPPSSVGFAGTSSQRGGKQDADSGETLEGDAAGDGYVPGLYRGGRYVTTDSCASSSNRARCHCAPSLNNPSSSSSHVTRVQVGGRQGTPEARMCHRDSRPEVWQRPAVSLATFSL